MNILNVFLNWRNIQDGQFLMLWKIKFSQLYHDIVLLVGKLLPYKACKRGTNYCNRSCQNSNKNIINKKKLTSKETCLKKYGFEHQSKNPKIKNKVKQTCLNKYGVSTNLIFAPHNSSTMKKTCLEKYRCFNYI